MNGVLSKKRIFIKFSQGFLCLLLLCFCMGLDAQNYILQGVVNDERTDSPIAGVRLRVKSSSIASTTDINGQFSLNADKFPLTLELSFIGYKTKKITISNTQPLRLLLQQDENKLDEVVIVGYNTTRRENFTGSASRIVTDYTKNTPVQSFDQALSGKAAGVNIALPNGVLNNAPVIRIRGVNSISLSSYPLIVVNGIPITSGDVSTGAYVGNNPLADINPADIESVDVLKDAASTAIYGSRAAAGVIVISTKKGKADKTRVHYDYSLAATKAVRLPKVLNATDYMLIKNEAVLNAKILSGNENNSNVASALYFPSYNADGSEVNTNWYDFIYRTGVSQNHNLSISGGNNATKYYFSANYSKQSGVLVDNDFKRKGIYFNLEHDANSWLQLKGSLSYNNTFNQAQNTGSLKNSTFLLIGAARMAMVLPPNVAAYKADGSFNITSAGRMSNGNNQITSSYYNPLALFANSKYTSENDHIIGGMGATVKLSKNMDITTNYSLDRLKTENVSFVSAQLGSTGYSQNGSVTNTTGTRDNWDWSTVLNYKTDFAQNHIGFLAGYEQQKYYTSVWGANASNASDPFFEYYQGGWSLISASDNFLSEKSFVSYFSRLNYDFDNRYLLTFNFRRDGNSALAAGKQYGNFGGISGGWNVSGENFFKDSKFSNYINSLKLRAGWGIVGNGNLPTDYGSLYLYSSSLYGSAATWSINQAGNEDLGWETSKQTNIGFDISLLNNKIQAGFSYFDNNIDGLILSSPQSPSKGIPGNAILANVGSMYNRGVELELNAHLVATKDFDWNVSFNYTHVANKVTALAQGNADIISYTHISSESTNITRVGYSVGSIYAAKTDGVNPENGRRIFINAKGEKVQYSAAVAVGQSNWTYLDGTTAPAITAADYQIVGNAIPTWYGGIGNNLRYKQFDMSINFSYSGGNYVMNGTRGTLLDLRYQNNSTEILNRWTTPGQLTKIPRVVYSDQISNGTAFPISKNAQKADFLRLSSLSLGYTLPENLPKKVGLTSLRVFIQGTNLLLITGYKGTDPELSVNGNSNLTPGVEKNSVGLGRTFTFGLNIMI
jgi:TonB-dependent starch-binding outer membrane protein SusC